MWVILIAFVLHWYLSLFFQSFFHHRYAAHGQFTMPRWMEKVCFVGSYIFMGSNYLSPYGYGVMHRMHHSFADTEEDPHSPKYSKNIFQMMWQTKEKYSALANKKVDVDEKFTKGVPEWRWFDDFARSWFSRLAWSAAYIWFYIEFVPEGMWYLYLLLPINLMMSPVHGAIINWYAHIFGYRNYKQDNTSRNLLPLDFLMWGESYHNNHHMHGNSANFGGVRWHEIDPMYLIIKGMNKIGLIKLVKNEPVLKYKKAA
jgi:stearoyl-CoA desaturase (delta-9 desaturase)